MIEGKKSSHYIAPEHSPPSVSELPPGELIDNLPTIIWVTDPSGRIEYVNRAYKDFFGVAREEVASAGWQALVHPDDRDAFFDELITSLKEQCNFHALARLRRCDGTWRWFDSYGKPRISQNGEFLGMAGSSQDVTERIVMEERLAHQADILDKVYDAVIATDEQYRITSWNRAAEEMYGWKASEAVGQVVQTLIRPEFSDEHRLEALKTLADQGFFRVEVVQHRRDGTKLFIEGLTSAVKDSTGNVCGFVSVNRDVTLRKQAENALQASEERLRLANRAIPGIIYDWDMTSGEVFRSEGLERVIGFRPSQATPRHEWWLDRVHPDDRDRFERWTDEMLSGDLDIHEWEYRVRHKDGRWIWVLDRGYLIRGADKRPVRLVGSTSDITLQKEAAEALHLNNERFKIALAHAGITTFSQDRDLRYTWSDNPLYGDYSHIGKTDEEAGFASDVTELVALKRQVLESGQGVRREIQLLIQDQLFYYDLIVDPLRDASGAIVGIIGSAADITSRITAQLALREQEERYRVASMSFPAIYAQTDSELRYTWIYNTHPDFHPDEVIGKRDDELADDDGTRRLVELKRMVFESGEGCREEITFPRSNGIVTYDINLEPMRDHEGRVIGVTTAALDITERKQMEQELRASESRFRQLADAMPQLVWTALPDGTVDYYNRRVAEFDGIHLNQSGTWGWQPVLHPDDIESTVLAWQQAVESGEVYQAEHKIRMADGSYRWHLSRGLPVRDERGRITRWFGTATDIHDQKTAQNELQDAYARLKRLVDSNIIGVGISGPNGEVFEANDYYLDLLGYSRQDFEQGLVNWINCTPPEYQPLDEQATKELEQYGVCQPYEKEYLRKDGSRVWAMLHVAKLPAGEIIALLQDITDRKKSETAIHNYAEQLQQSNKELQDFAFIASHDLQEPLRKIISFSHIIASSQNLVDSEKDYIQRVMDSARRMQKMIRDLLELSRISTDTQAFEPVDLNRVVHAIVDDLQLRLQLTKGRVIVNPLPIIEADATQMQQLFLNLVGNAIKFSQPGVPPVVTIGLQEGPTGKAKIFVRDNGIGFNMDFMEQIFEPFRRLHGRGEYEGSGIGLAVCRKIVERHGGLITVQSTPGEGSTFTVLLPVRHLGE